MLKNNHYIFSYVIIVFFCSCDSKQIFDEYQSLPTKWNKDSIINFNITAPDSTKSYNLFVNLRNNKDYKYSNLQLIVALEYPNGKTEKDTLEYAMAKPNGEFLGEGFTDVKENKLWYKGYDSDFKFTEIGNYKISVQQAMRENGQVEGIENLDGIMAVGFRIENSN